MLLSVSQRNTLDNRSHSQNKDLMQCKEWKPPWKVSLDPRKQASPILALLCPLTTVGASLLEVSVCSWRAVARTVFNEHQWAVSLPPWQIPIRLRASLWFQLQIKKKTSRTLLPHIYPLSKTVRASLIGLNTSQTCYQPINLQEALRKLGWP